MPIFDYECYECRTKLIDEFVHNIKDVINCPRCGIRMDRQFPTKVGPLIFPIDGRTIEHAGPEPIHFDSYKKMKKYAKDHNLQFQAIL
jgi:hypothetical protein